MADLDQIIERAHRADHGVAQRTAIDGAIAADFHLVLDDDTADLEDAHRAFGAWHKAEAFAADGNILRDADLGADQGVADAGVGADHGVVADDHAVADHRIGSEAAARADLRIFAHHRAAGDFGVVADMGAGGDESAGMDESLGLGAGVKQLADMREGEAGIFGQQQGAAIMRIGAEFAAGDDHAGMAGGEGRGMTGIAENGQFPRRRVRQFSHVVDHFVRTFGVSQFGAHDLGDTAQ